ncbi:MAG: hypothetical protein IJH99_06310 [Eubacterium sp.]|nr:hypothetical protein [Eubacterium sp.]
MTDIYRFADVDIRISSVHEKVHRLCEDYRTDGGTYDFAVETTPEDIEYERERSARTDELEGIPVRSFSDGYLEELAVYRKMAEILPDYDTLLMHGSAVAVDGAAYLFIAKSGTGKSTHTRLWRELLKEKAVMINDDKPLVRVTEGGAVIYGTPWDGKHRLSTNTACPLAAVCILERAKDNHIRQIDRSEALPMLLQQTYRPEGIPALTRMLELTEKLAASVRLYRLGCNMDISAAKLSYEAMRKDE